MKRRSAIRISISTFAALGTFVALSLASSATSAAAPSCTSVSPALDQQVTCTYSGGGFTDLSVPAGANGASIILNGAGGGGGGFASGINDGASGGAGARVTANINVTGIQTLRLVLGLGGTGGAPAVGFGDGGGGGGFSAIFRGSTSASSQALVVAGGGGGGGSGVPAAVGGSGSAGGTGAGGNGGSVDPGLGAPGDGNGGAGGGFDGASGQTWAAGGAGGAPGTSPGGTGGAGYGGGGGSAGGSYGGGAGGSFVDANVQIGVATYSASGGAGGLGGQSLSGPAQTGSHGSAVITFTFTAPPPPDDQIGQVPAPVLLQVGLVPGATCDEGWSQSWADWAVPITGGPVCSQMIVYRDGRWMNRDYPSVPFDSPWN